MLGRTLAELEVLCGSDRVGSPQVADSHHPDAYRMAPFQPTASDAQFAQFTPSAPSAPSTGSATLAMRALRPPVRASVRIARGAPEFVRSVIANGSVVRVAGPWRTTGGWWSREGHFAFDSYDIQTSDGTVARLRLDHLTKIWQIDAVYD